MKYLRRFHMETRKSINSSGTVFGEVIMQDNQIIIRHNTKPELIITDPAVIKEVFNKTRDILLRVINQPFIAPTANNSIQLEYHNDDGAYLEFEVFVDSVKIFFLHGASYTKPLTNLSDINLMIIDFLYGNYNSIINMEGNKDECN